MKNYIVHDEWKIIESGFHPEYNEVTESLMSLGNGRMGQRGNFEETYSGHTLQGNYVAGVWFPDKTRVGWWKNGYPNYFAKVINSVNWIGIDVEIDGDKLDLHTAEILEFQRELNMHHGYLHRFCTIRLQNGKEIKIDALRFCSLANDEVGQVDYTITPLNFNGEIKITPYLDGDVKNRDSNYEERFWDEIEKEITNQNSFLQVRTKENKFGVEKFDVAVGMNIFLSKNGHPLDFSSKAINKVKFVGNEITVLAQKGDAIRVLKTVVVHNSNNFAPEKLKEAVQDSFKKIEGKHLFQEHRSAWKAKWENCDIKIEGDVAAQQAIRFNIFQLLQTYTGEDSRLNIGPKGFTGEKYGGVTYWDTEAYCLPFYLATCPPQVGRNLVVYRHNHLQKAIENAQKLGFNKGAALYPMVTMNGEECHNEWEITFEEIHRNGAIAYGIYDYINYTGDEGYLAEYGLDVLIGIARFWSQRVNWSAAQNKYVMLGVTGPNEYENNVNNNWYTNYIAIWCLKYTLESIEKVRNSNASRLSEILTNLNFDSEKETSQWKHIVENMYFPYDSERQVFLQQDGFLDKELLSVDKITEHRPINQKWSWDRILRSCFIKQADVLQGMYFFEDDFTEEELRRNFDFYEPMTVHESSLSPCVHVIHAARLGKKEKAYEMYLRTARLDLDDYNNDTEDGLHITSMAGTWLSVVKGFGGMRIKDGQLHFNPFLPEQWQSFNFRVGFRGNLIEIIVSNEETEIRNLSEADISIFVHGNEVKVEGNTSKSIQFKQLEEA